MDRTEMTRKVIELAAEQVGAKPQEVTPATHFVNDLNFDSLNKVEFVMELEDEFGTSVDDETAEKLHTVGEVVEYIEKRISQEKDKAA
jgi:acyl carrier protein